MKNQVGFTLLELAIVLLIIGLLISSVLMPLIASKTAQDVRKTEDMLEKAKGALLGYAIIREGFPCPDNNSDGIADSPCSTYEGDLPWLDLGIQTQDAWGSNIQYRIYDTYQGDNSLGSGLPSITNGIQIQDTNTNSLTRNDVIVAVIFSPGKNRTAETENANDDNFYVKDNFIEGTFDDITTWISRNTLAYHFVSAGKQP